MTGPGVALACDAIGALLVAAFGVIYFTRKQFMSYHAAALGTQWPDLDPRVRILLLAFMRSTGGLCIAIAFLELVLLYLGFRHAVPWALYAAAIGGLLVTMAFVVGMSIVSRHTEARPPWLLAVVGGSLFLVGLCAAALT